MAASPGPARRIHFWLFIAWLIPGAILSWLLRNSVPWVTLMSWYAIICTHATGWGAGRAEDAANNQSDR